MRGRVGFTLIELMIVCGIIAVLAAILWPIFLAARESSRQSSCASNQRQIAAALLIWAENHNERLPYPADAWTLLELPPNVLKCPSEQDRANGYVYNTLVGGMLVDLPTEPMETVLTADGTAESHLLVVPEDLAPRHNGRYLASFVDGHVEPVALTASTAGDELGQLVEGCGSANFAWLQYPGVKFADAFKSPKTGTVTQFTLQWKKDGGYGHGTYGRYTFELQTNGKDLFPSDEVLASVTNVNPIIAMDGYADGALHVEMTAALEQGKSYSLVITNTDPDPGENWSSPNTLMTRVKPWDGSGCRAAALTDGVWKPWASRHPSNIYNTWGINAVNGGHAPIMLTWQDGTHTGDPYYSAMVKKRAFFCAEEKAGEFIVWNRPTTKITRIGLVVTRVGTPATLNYHLETADETTLATGPLATAGQVGATPTWVFATLGEGVTLQEGQAYRLWFDSPDSPTRDNSFFQFIPYGENRPEAWLECGWGGTASCYTAILDGAWELAPHADLSFSLQ